MPKVEKILNDEVNFTQKQLDIFQKQYSDLPVEGKWSSFGRLNGKLVVVDYG